MSMVIKYAPFFSVTMISEINGTPISGFSFFPLMKCRHELQNFNMVFRPRPSGFDVYYCTTPLISIDSLKRFSFGFRIHDTGFLNRYGLTSEGPADPEKYQPNLYFDNLASDGSVITTSPSSLVTGGLNFATVDDTYQFYPQTFTVKDEPGDTAPTEYTLTDLYNPATVQTVPAVQGSPDDFRYTIINSVDLKEEYLGDVGPYMLSADTEPDMQRVYLDNELSRSRAHGVINIFWETAQNTISDPTLGLQYTITFKPK